MKNKANAVSILQDLEDIYLQAMEKGNLAVALKVKELLGREQGLFSYKGGPTEKRKLCLADLSEEDIMGLIKEIETQLALDPEKGAE